MIVHSLEVKNDPFCPCEKGEELIDLEVSYLSVIDALMYLVNYIRLDIASFFFNLLVKYNSAPTPKTLELYQTYIALPLRNN